MILLQIMLVLSNQYNHTNIIIIIDMDTSFSSLRLKGYDSTTLHGFWLFRCLVDVEVCVRSAVRLLVLFYQLLVRFSAVLKGTSDPGQWRRKTII